ncbi:MAG: flavodoxin family protein [Planctomycetota bacterium]
MTKIAVVYHSGFGHTEVLAHRLAEGARSVEGATASLCKVTDLAAPTDEGYSDAWSDVNEADAIVFGSPTYMGTVSAPFKVFMDNSAKAWFGQSWKDKLAGGFTNSGSPSGDKLNTLTTIAIFASQHSMLWVPPGVMPASPGEEGPNRLGAMLGTMAQSDNASPDVTPPESDRLFAEGYGKRMATLAKALSPALKTL